MLNRIKVEIEAREVSERVHSSSQSIKKPGAHPTVGAFVERVVLPFKYEEPHYSVSCKRVVDNEGWKLIDILIGADYYWQIVTGEVAQADDCPMAISSKLGWLLSRPCKKLSNDDRAVNNFLLAGECIDNTSSQIDCDDELVNVSKRFGDTENIGIKSIDYKKPCESQFLKEVWFTGGRYKVGLT